MKSDFIIDPIGKKDAEGLLLKYHYLKDHSKGFKSGYNYGLFRDEPISSEGTLGVCIFTGLPVPELAQSAFGLQRDQQDGLFELSRLCLHPSIQRSEKNMATWFVSRCLRRLRQRTMVRAVLSYADADYHEGTIYRAANFDYYGLTDPKKDFWIKQEDGSFVKHSRGKMSGLDGEWRNRSRKHRFLMVYDKTLNVLWNKE
tara:strand:- start:21 stop:620 length:600 start_codon:yes stop_codon:yes gene_type:complete